MPLSDKFHHLRSDENGNKQQYRYQSERMSDIKIEN